MNRWRIAGVVAGLLAACVAAVPVMAMEWCLDDPSYTVTTPSGNTVTVYVTQAVLGSQHAGALQSSKLTYTSAGVGLLGLAETSVTISDTIPADRYGTFPTEMTVSSEPMGAGTVYGQASGTSGIPMAVTFTLNTP